MFNQKLHRFVRNHSYFKEIKNGDGVTVTYAEKQSNKLNFKGELIQINYATI